MKRKPINEWKETIYPALVSKQRELQLVGYGEVTIDEIWACLEQTVWKGQPTKHLYEVVQDVFHLSASVFMNYMTANALKSDETDLFAAIQAVTGED